MDGKTGICIGLGVVILGPLIWAVLKLAGVEVFDLINAKKKNGRVVQPRRLIYPGNAADYHCLAQRFGVALHSVGHDRRLDTIGDQVIACFYARIERLLAWTIAGPIFAVFRQAKLEVERTQQ